MQLRLQIAAAVILVAQATGFHAAEPIPLSRAEAPFQAGDAAELAQVVDGVAAGPHGWSVSPRLSEPQAIVFRCAQPVETAELDITLFFLSGRPNNSIAEFALFYTTDAEPSLKGNWKPLEIQRFTAEVHNQSLGSSDIGFDLELTATAPLAGLLEPGTKCTVKTAITPTGSRPVEIQSSIEVPK